jgi:hypothetical protein
MSSAWLKPRSARPPGAIGTGTSTDPGPGRGMTAAMTSARGAARTLRRWSLRAEMMRGTGSPYDNACRAQPTPGMHSAQPDASRGIG